MSRIAFFERCVNRLAETLAAMENPPISAVERLLASHAITAVPLLPAADNAHPHVDASDARCRAVVLACGRFLIHSRGQHADLIVPRIINVLDALYLFYVDQAEAAEKLAQEITAALILAACGSAIAVAQVISTNLFRVFTDVAALWKSTGGDGPRAVLTGMMRALSQPSKTTTIGLTSDFLAQMLSWSNDFEEPPTAGQAVWGVQLLTLQNSLAEKLLKSRMPTEESWRPVLTSISATCLANFKKRSEQLFQQTSHRNAEEDLALLTATATTLATSVLDEDTAVHAANALADILKVVVEAKDGSPMVPLATACVRGLAAIIDAFPSLASLALEACKDFVSQPTSILAHVEDQVLLRETTQCLTNALLAESRGGDSQTPRKRPLSFSSDSLVAFARTESNLSEQTVPAALDEAVAESLINSLSNRLYMNESRRTSRHLVVALGAIACTVPTRSARHLVVNVLIQRLASPPSQLDATIVEQLAFIASISAAEKDEHGNILSLLKQVILDALTRGREVPEATKLYETSTINKENGTAAALALSVRSNSRNLMDGGSSAVTTSADSLYSFCTAAVADALIHLVRHIDNHYLLADLQVTLAELFIKLGWVLHDAGYNALPSQEPKEVSAKTRGSEHDLMASNLFNLLPIVAELAERVRDDSDPAPRTVQIFRDMWFYCVLLGLTDLPEHNRIADALDRLAVCSPALVSRRTRDFLDEDLERGGLLNRDSFSPEDNHQLRSRLAAAFPSVSTNAISKLSPAQCTYMLSAWHLETRRARQGNFRLALLYLGDKGIDQTDLKAFARPLADSAFKVYLESMHRRPLGLARENDLSAMTIVLLIAFNHRNKHISRGADDYLTELINEFPQMSQNQLVVSTMLDTLHCLAELVDTATLNCAAERLEVSHTSVHLTVPGDRKWRESILVGFHERAEILLKHAETHAQSQIRLVLQEYIASRSRDRGMVSNAHAGLSMAARFASTGIVSDALCRPRAVLAARPHVAVSALAPFVSGNQLRSRIEGEVRGIVISESNRGHALDQREYTLDQVVIASHKDSHKRHSGLIDLPIADLNRVGTVDAGADGGYIANRLVGELESAISSPDDNVFAAAMHRASAYTVVAPQPHRPLLRLLCHAVVSRFNTSGMEVSVFCWNWVTAARPVVELQLLKELASAWTDCMTHKLGFFGSLTEVPDPLFTSNTSSASHSQHSHPDDEPSGDAHRLWIQFLLDRFLALHSCSASRISVIAEMVMCAINDPLKVSPRAAFLGSRARLTLLALKIAQSKHGSPLIRHVFRERAYVFALHWFRVRPRWQACHSRRARVEEDMADLVALRRCITHDKRIIKTVFGNEHQELLAVKLASHVSVPNGSTNGATAALATALSAPTVTFKSNTKKGDPEEIEMSELAPASRLLAPLGTAPHTSSSVVAQSVRSALSGIENTELLRDIKRLRLLVQLLLRYELSRISAWHNPSNVPDLTVDGENDESNKLKPEDGTVPEKAWKDHVQVCWKRCPAACVQLIYIFPQAESLRREVARMVCSFPEAVEHVPEALPLLITPEAIDRNAAELAHCLTWTNVAPTVALEFFSKMYPSHPIVAQYAVRVLRSFPPDMILFYIPQLVQALRYDRLGYVSEYILGAAKSSQLLAHQFLWNMQTNVYKDEHELEKDELAPTLERLMDSIKAQMDVKPREFYQREFDFFAKITNISGTMKREVPEFKTAEDKASRKTICLHELKQIKVAPGVYLPSNPTAIVMDIKYESAAPMQSAAKAPFFASFLVKPCSLDELENLDANVSTRRAFERSSLVTQSCIFKVGDDVRQDMLALQVIQLFQRIFAKANLDVYLAPYRVVATGPGSGVIEVVPDTKSRDQLGRQTDVTLFDYFAKTYGDIDSVEFERARLNFVRSMAAYSVVSFLLQIKDRHNGNLLVDKAGHIVHIDFGFMFESSPGGNIGFEPDIKLTHEMVMVMGGDINDFTELTTRAYLAVRPYHESVTSLVALMLDTGLPCFRTPKVLQSLRHRFQVGQTDKEAASFMIQKIKYSYMNLRTKLYDWIQYKQNGIPYF